MKISVIGAGYVGLITGACFAKIGHEVTLVEKDSQKVRIIKQGKSPIYEKDLAEIIATHYGENLIATTCIERAVEDSEITFICVGTPSKKDNSVDLRGIKKVAGDIGKALKKKHMYYVIAVKSTVLPGTTRNMIIPVLEKSSGKKAGKGFGIVVNPEFLREGISVHDFLNPDRIIIGSLDEKSYDITSYLYKDLTAPILKTSLEVAEMTKYASNAFLATKISFMNEIGNICKKLGIDTNQVAEGLGLDHRISPHYLQSGLGFSGSCFPKDIKALIAKAEEIGYNPALLKSVNQLNKTQPLRILELTTKKLGKLPNKVAILGLAFKAGTDDVREAPCLKIIPKLIENGTVVKVYDPRAMEKIKKIFGGRLQYTKQAKEAVKGVNVVFLLTEWEEFKNLNLYKGKVVFDGRRILDVDKAKKVCAYEGICW